MFNFKRNFEQPGRSTVMSCKAMAATSHPLSTQTALKILRQGGNAMDAAIAACAVQCVVEPQSTGIGGDCFVLYAPEGRSDVIAYNGSGHTPAAAHNEWYQEQGITQIERTSPHAVTVPGAVAAWWQLHQDHGALDWAEILVPAIAYACDGYPITARVAYDWQKEIGLLAQNGAAAQALLVNGQAPQAGSLHRQPKLGETLQIIAEQGRDGFYQDAVAEDIVNTLHTLGGLHTLDDFAAAKGEYVQLIQTDYRGYQVIECPPNGQGIVALQMLNILQDFSPVPDPLSAERLHLQIEAKRLAYHDRDRYLADPEFSEIPVEQLLSRDYAKKLAAQINPLRASKSLPRSEFPQHKDTVYLCVVDHDGNTVSFINSLFHSFGSTIMAVESGVCLHSRGSSFVIDPEHPNTIASRKRPMHTIIPAMLAKNDRIVMPFGVMGGHYQANGQAHFLSNMLDYGMDVQAAIDCPRVFAEQNDIVQVENRISQATRAGLVQHGHRIIPAEKPIGGAQAIWIDHDQGVLSGGSDPRKDGCALGY